MVKEIMRSFSIVGVKKECLLKDFQVAIPEARSELHHRVNLRKDDTEFIAYQMTEEALRPNRKEVFYVGRMLNQADNDNTCHEMECINIVDHWYVTITHNGSGQEKQP